MYCNFGMREFTFLSPNKVFKNPGSDSRKRRCHHASKRKVRQMLLPEDIPLSMNTSELIAYQSPGNGDCSILVHVSWLVMIP